jgi:hypothetical protein
VEARIVRERRDSIAWLRGQVEKEFAEKIHPARMAERILSFPDTAKYFDLEAEPFFVPDMIERVIEEAIEQRRKRGLWRE